MIIHLLCVSVLFLSLPACLPVASPETATRQESTERTPPPSEARDVLTAFTPLTRDAWQVTFVSGTSMFRTSHWGPGQHSIVTNTDGSGAAGEPWRSLRVIYWHPGRNQFRLFGLSPYARSVSEGTVSLDGKIPQVVYDLYQEGGVRRSMVLRWTLESPDRVREKLMERTGTPGLVDLVDLEFNRIERSPTESAVATRETVLDSKYLQSIASAMGRAWVTDGVDKNGEATETRTTFEWVPHADFIRIRTEALKEGQEPRHLAETYLYHHTGFNALRSLTLSASGAVQEGTITLLENGSVDFALKTYEEDRVTQRIERWDFADGSLRERHWSLEGTERTLQDDVLHRKLNGD